MGKTLIYLLFLIGLLLFIYYLYMIVSGKRVAKMIGTKDRFIWNGLKNISAKGSSFAGKRNTLFLDNDNLVITDQGIHSIMRELRETQGLNRAVAIPFHRIISFDYKRSVAEWNIVFRAILSLWNRLLKKNDYQIQLRYLDDNNDIQQFRFKASSMDELDFENTFADFDNQIYSGKVVFEAEHEGEELPIPVPVKEEPVEKDLSLNFKAEGSTDTDVILPIPEEPQEPTDKTMRIDDVVEVAEPVQEAEVGDETVRIDTVKEEIEEEVPDEIDYTVDISRQMPLVEDEIPFETIPEEDQTKRLSMEEIRDTILGDRKKVTFERPRNLEVEDLRKLQEKNTDDQ